MPADRMSIRLDESGIMQGNRIRAMGPLIGTLAMERGLKSAGRVVGRNTKRNLSQSVLSRTGNLLSGMVVRGSAAVKYMPSARVSGAPHLQLIELGHRVVSHGRDTGRRTRPRRVVARALKQDTQAQIAAITKSLTRQVETLQRDLVTKGLDGEEKAKRFVQRQLKREARQARRV